MTDLQATCRSIDGRPYPAYRDLRGRWDVDELVVCIDRVQGDPFASPSRLTVELQTDIPGRLLVDRDHREAVEDALLRAFAQGLNGSRRGSGKSGQLGVYRPGPEVCERSAVRIDADGWVRVRFTAGLPAKGRRVLGRAAAEMLTQDVPRAARRLLDLAPDVLEAHVHSVLRQRALRRSLRERGLVGFIGNGSVLPRASGVSTRPLPDAVPFESPPSLAVTLTTPYGDVTGMGIAKGVTVLTGGGFHGKSTVLQALQTGHLDHIPGDGRETVVSSPHAVKIRAEDGRPVHAVDISPFLGSLPGGRTTTPFVTRDASGSTSQAASILEAIEAGADLLLVDEDTSATNLLVRDPRMAALIPADREPITPFLVRVRQLAEQGISTVLVVGGVADYLGVADQVVTMTDWRPSDVTEAAHALVPERPAPPGPFTRGAPRTPRRHDLDRVRARDTRAVSIDKVEIDLTAVEQVLDGPHAATLGHALRFLLDLADGRRPLPMLLDAFEAIVDDEGIEAVSTWSSPEGTLVRPRRHELAATLNRYRNLQLQ